METILHVRHDRKEDGRKDDRTPAIQRYFWAVLAALVALLLRQFLSPLLGAYNPYHTVWAAVFFSACYCGLGPSVLTALISATGVWLCFLPPFGRTALSSPRAQISGVVGFLVLSGFIIALGELNRRSNLRSERMPRNLSRCGRASTNKTLTSGTRKTGQAIKFARE